MVGVPKSIILRWCAGMEEKHSEIYMKKSQIDDQTASASGYAYQINSDGPARYTTFTTNGGNLNNFGYPPVTLGRYISNVQELPLEPAKYFVPTVGGGGNGAINSYGLPVAVPATYNILEPVKDSIDLQTNNLQYTNPIKEIANTQYAEGNGANYNTAQQSSHGAKGENGYKNIHEYDKGAQGKHANEQHKAYYNKEGGNKANHYETGAHHGAKEAAAKAVKGASFKESSGHKKGSKTTGFHNVYHKDEYKKDHSFYDESDKSGHFNKYGDYDARQAAEKGAFVKGANENAGYKGNEYGAKGYSDKGRFIDNGSGYRGASGKDSYYKDNSEYAKKGGQEQVQQHGYQENQSNH